MTIESAFVTVEHSSFNFFFFFFTNVTFVFVILINSTFIAESEIFSELKVNFLFVEIWSKIFDYWLRFEKVLWVTKLALKAFIAFPATVWNTWNLGFLACSVKCFITFITIKQLIFSFCRTTLFTIFAIGTFPVKSIFFNVLLRYLDAIVMKRLST